jgi:hypothetical protein
MAQRVVISRYRTADGTGPVERSINTLLEAGWRVIPNTHAIYTDPHAWTTLMVFLEREDQSESENREEDEEEESL